MWRYLVLCALIACTKSSAPPAPEVATPTTKPTPSAPADAARADAARADAAVPDAAVALAIHEAPGVGTCRTDADCILSSAQEGCCTQACEPQAISWREDAAREANKHCPSPRTEPCPPPAPCAKRVHDVIGAKCAHGRCVSIQRDLPPP